MDGTRKSGKRPIKGEAMTPAELQARHREKIRSEGGKFIQVTIENAEHASALQQVRDQNSLRSDTAAANFIIKSFIEKEILK